MLEKMKVSFNNFSLPLISILLIGSIVNGQTPGVEAPTRLIANENYKIGPGDVIDVVVSKNDTLSRSGLRVSNQGTIQLAMLDHDVQAACLSERQLADVIKEQYRKYLIDPFVNVSVREFNSNPVAVIGAVNAPGRFQLQRQIRLVELLSFVNGPSDKAGRTVEIIRNLDRPYCDELKLVTPVGGGEDLISVNLSDIFKSGDHPNPLIIAGDIVRVAAADQMNAYIQGNVRNGLAINLKDPVTLTQAVAMAGGLAPGAETERVSIRRQIPGSLKRDEIVINLKEINQRKRDDILLQPNDIVEVPGPSGLKKVFGDILKTVVPTITQLPMRVIY
jgi:polysaccharide export outer membrane protein